MIEKVYVTKYALTEGVRLCDVVEIYEVAGARNRVRVKWLGGLNGEARFRLGEDAFVSQSDAADKFEDMRESALRAAERKIDRLRVMKFEVKE